MGAVLSAWLKPCMERNSKTGKNDIYFKGKNFAKANEIENVKM